MLFSVNLQLFIAFIIFFTAFDTDFKFLNFKELTLIYDTIIFCTNFHVFYIRFLLIFLRDTFVSKSVIRDNLGD